MKLINSLLLLLFTSTLLSAQQPSATPAKPVTRCHPCVQRVSKTQPAPAPTPLSPAPDNYFVGEARVDVTKDETVVRLAMAQHGSVLIELPINDGPRYIIPGDPEMASVDQKALERNKRAIIVRPGAQFVPPSRHQKARTPAATVTAQMRSGLVVTFLFYPVEDLAQNVHRCVLSYNRDDVVARRRAAGLPVNLGTGNEGGEMPPQPAAPTSISVDGTSAETGKQKVNADVTAKPLPSPDSRRVTPAAMEKKNKSGVEAAATAARALQAAVKQPKQFKNWTKPVHGLALSFLQPPKTAEDFNVIIVAVRNRTGGNLKLSAGSPDLLVELQDDHGKAVNIESIQKIATEASASSASIAPGATLHYAIAYPSAVLNSHQHLKVIVGQTNAADEPASIILPNNQR